ncbi:ATP-binding cassette subfamily B protein [Anseongella ginsenosidimutans]|uniref:ATP-binding cassette subfamily B protein n=1 Tax=Anseongella ginsenosidimutans TaxID=496056 RepID=A0A4R3KUB1_9SPHI|nr:ABC transporter transmembrane domain-containing protein [Anseongella ginsenosidimutans]TCS88393.1 ATP-binding cassette subfamily B protein [Anseongella ginsenosidimutans]
MARERLNSSNPAAQEVPKAKINKQSLNKISYLLKYLRPYRWKFSAGIFFLMLTSVAMLLIPNQMGKLIDAATQSLEGGPGSVDRIALVLLGILVVQAILSFFRVYWFVEVAEKSLAQIRKDLYNKLIRLPMEFFNKNRVGELSSRISADLSQIQDSVTTTLAQFLRQLLFLVGGIIALTFVSGKLTLMMLCVLPLLVVVAIVFGRYIRKLSRKAQDQLAESNVVVEETLQGISNVKAFTNEPYEAKRYAGNINRVVSIALKNAKFRAGFISFISIGLLGVILCVVWFGSRMVYSGEISIGDLTKFILYSMFVGGAMGGFAELYTQLQKTVGASERVLELLQEGHEPIEVSLAEAETAKAEAATAGMRAVATPAGVATTGTGGATQAGPVTAGAGGEGHAGPATYGTGAGNPQAASATTPQEKTAGHQLRGSIIFDQISFQYPGRAEVPVLRDVSFEAGVGERIALVGPSGAGKSTIASLVLRFYEPSGGRILFDNIPSTEFSLSDIRSQVAIVPQDVLLFGGSIMENISYGKIGSSRKEIEEAAHRANAHEFIMSFPEGYDTVVGERGVKLSGGQRQRIAIARALLKNPAILILDEATSSLDSESERLVQEALEELMKNRTSIIIAHRLSTIREADKIIVLDKGKVQESGRHQDLMLTDGLYRYLTGLQLEA